MAVNLSALAGAGQQFFDNSGSPLSGGKLWSYAAGTTTPQTTYTTVAGNVAHANPIILDSAGRVATGEIWLTAGSNYKFVLMTSTDVSLATWDNITGINGTGIASNAENVAYDPPFTGGLTSNYTVESKLAQTVSVKDFGAVGDGVADDTAAIQAAITASTRVYFPTGTYKTSATIIASFAKKQSPILYGDGPTATIIRPTNAVTRALQIGDTGNFTTNFAVRDIGIDMVNMVDLSTTAGLAFDSAFWGGAVNIRVINDGTNKRAFLFGPSCYVTSFKECIGRIFAVMGSSSVNLSTTVVIDNCEFHQVYLRNAEFINVINAHIGPVGSTISKFDCDTVRYLTVQGCDIEGSGTVFALGANCEKFNRIGNYYLGYSGGSYETGSFVDQQNSFTMDGFISAFALTTTQIQKFTSGYQGTTSQLFQTAQGALSGASFQHLENQTMRIKLGNSVSDQHVLFDVDANTQLATRNGTMAVGMSNGGAVTVWGTSKEYYPSDNDATTLGRAANKWSVVYAGTGTINTSDASQKQDVAELSNAEKQAALRIKGLIRKFRFKNAVAKKGNSARIHVGVLAQDVKSAFEAEGLDVTRYGIFCADVLEDGSTVYGVRYEELLAFVIGAL
jgi:hypothetical protein